MLLLLWYLKLSFQNNPYTCDILVDERGSDIASVCSIYSAREGLSWIISMIKNLFLTPLTTMHEHIWCNTHRSWVKILGCCANDFWLETINNSIYFIWMLKDKKISQCNIFTTSFRCLFLNQVEGLGFISPNNWHTWVLWFLFLWK